MKTIPEVACIFRVEEKTNLEVVVSSIKKLAEAKKYLSRVVLLVHNETRFLEFRQLVDKLNLDYPEVSFLCVGGLPLSQEVVDDTRYIYVWSGEYAETYTTDDLVEAYTNYRHAGAIMTNAGFITTAERYLDAPLSDEKFFETLKTLGYKNYKMEEIK